MDAARVHGEKAVARQKSNIDGRIGLAWYYMWRRDFSRARYQFDSVFKVNPYDQKVIYPRATSFTYLGNPQAALDLMQAAASTQPQVADMHAIIAAEACFFLSDFARAAELCDHLSDATKAAAHGVVIATYAAVNRLEDARREAEAYIARLRNSWRGGNPKRSELLEWELEHCYPLAKAEHIELLQRHLMPIVMR